MAEITYTDPSLTELDATVYFDHVLVSMLNYRLQYIIKGMSKANTNKTFFINIPVYGIADKTILTSMLETEIKKFNENMSGKNPRYELSLTEFEENEMSDYKKYHIFFEITKTTI